MLEWHQVRVPGTRSVLCGSTVRDPLRETGTNRGEGGTSSDGHCTS